MNELRRFARGFVYAGRGVWLAVRQERNFRFHLCAAAYVVAFAAAFYRFSAGEWALLALCIGGMFALELVNSAIERAVDRPDAQHDKTAGQAKDLAAGAVLVFAAATVVVAVCLFARAEELAAMGRYFAARPGMAALLLLSFAPAGWFVFCFGRKG